MKKETTSIKVKFTAIIPSSNITVKQNEGAVGTRSSHNDGTIHLVDENVFKILDPNTNTFPTTDYKDTEVEKILSSQYVHSADDPK